MKLLVTGFAPFNGETVNPSYQIVQRLPDKIGGAEVIRLELPVEFGRAGRLLAREVERVKPVLVLCLGQAGGRTGISLEQVGINLREASIPDNAGAQPSGEPVVPGGPAAYFTTLPNKRMCARIRAMGIPASISYSAGTYVCNDLLYFLLDELEKRHPGIRGGFIHVPYSPEQAAGKAVPPASLAVSLAASGIQAALEEALLPDGKGEEIPPQGALD